MIFLAIITQSIQTDRPEQTVYCRPKSDAAEQCHSLHCLSLIQQFLDTSTESHISNFRRIMMSYGVPIFRLDNFIFNCLQNNNNKKETNS